MDPRVQQLLAGMGSPMGPSAPPQPTHPAMLPGVLQIQTFSEPIEETEKLDARVNAWLADMPGVAAIIDRSLVVAEGRATLMLVIKIPTQ